MLGSGEREFAHRHAEPKVYTNMAYLFCKFLIFAAFCVVVRGSVFAEAK